MEDGTPIPDRPDTLFIDLEGTLYWRGAVIPGALETVSRLRSDGWELRFLSNTDSKTIETVHSDLTRMGFSVDRTEIFTPVSALLEFAGRTRGKRFHLLLSRELCDSLSRQLVTSEDEADYLVVGDVRESADYETLNTAFRLVMGGADILALQKGRYFVRENAYYLDTGAFVALLEFASAKKARNLGKPAREFFDLALQSAQKDPQRVIVIGDDVSTDICGAKTIGSRSILVKTGKFDQAQLDASVNRPDAVVDSIACVCGVLPGFQGKPLRK